MRISFQPCPTPATDKVWKLILQEDKLGNLSYRGQVGNLSYRGQVGNLSLRRPTRNPTDERDRSSTPVLAGPAGRWCPSSLPGMSRGPLPPLMCNLAEHHRQDRAHRLRILPRARRRAFLWKADLGNHAYGGPIVAGGKVFVGTNNEKPRDSDEKGAGRDDVLRAVGRQVACGRPPTRCAR